MVGPPSDELNCSVCNEASDATVMFEKVHSLRRRQAVSVSLIVKFCLGVVGAMVVLLACCGQHGGERQTAGGATDQATMSGAHADSSKQTAFLSP